MVNVQASEAMFGWAVKKVMNAAELQRVGTSHASFDRYQLTNLTEFAFFCTPATKLFAQFSWLRTCKLRKFLCFLS